MTLSQTIEMRTMHRRSAEREVALACALAFVLLVPFINKAYTIDDPLFLRAAQQIEKHPADFYGFRINWAAQWLR